MNLFYHLLLFGLFLSTVHSRIACPLRTSFENIQLDKCKEAEGCQMNIETIKENFINESQRNYNGSFDLELGQKILVLSARDDTLLISIKDLAVDSKDLIYIVEVSQELIEKNKGWDGSFEINTEEALCFSCLDGEYSENFCKIDARFDNWTVSRYVYLKIVNQNGEIFETMMMNSAFNSGKNFSYYMGAMFFLLLLLSATDILTYDNSRQTPSKSSGTLLQEVPVVILQMLPLCAFNFYLVITALEYFIVHPVYYWFDYLFFPIQAMAIISIIISQMMQYGNILYSKTIWYKEVTYIFWLNSFGLYFCLFWYFEYFVMKFMKCLLFVYVLIIFYFINFLTSFLSERSISGSLKELKTKVTLFCYLNRLEFPNETNTSWIWGITVAVSLILLLVYTEIQNCSGARSLFPRSWRNMMIDQYKKPLSLIKRTSNFQDCHLCTNSLYEPEFPTSQTPSSPSQSDLDHCYSLPCYHSFHIRCFMENEELEEMQKEMSVWCPCCDRKLKGKFYVDQEFASGRKKD